MADVFHSGDTAYIVDNIRFLREVTIVRVTKDFCVIRYKDTSGGIRVRKSRLFLSKDAANKSMPPSARPKKASHWDCYMNH